jgi:hypothetical protein
MATRKPMKKFKRYEGGGEVMGEMDPMEAAAKKRGLEMSNKEAPVGFFERIRAGNIDQPGTEAYNRFGAGRGRDRGESVSVNQPMPSAPAAPAAPAASSRPLSDPMYSDYGSNTGMGAAGTSETVKPTRPVPAKPVAPAKPSVGSYTPPATRDKPNFSNEGRTKPAPAGSSMASQIPGQSAQAPQGQKIDSSETSRNLENAATALGVGAGAAGLYKLGRKLFSGGKEAAKKAAPYLKEIGTNAPKKLLEGPRTATKSADVTDVVPKSTSYRSLTGSAREDARANEAREKLRNSSFIKKPKKPLDESDTTGGAVGFKRGGKMKKYASGGMVSSASRRADGIATKGKTNCKMR